MRGRTALRPLAEVAAAAGRVFVEKGFRQAGISDVSTALGLSHGALYTYVESKQALLYLALIGMIQPDAVDGLAVPVPTPAPQEIVALVDAWANAQTGVGALGRANADPAAGRSAGEELGEIVDELYDFLENNRDVISLVEQCATDLPDVAQWLFVQRRRTMLRQLGEYLDARIIAGRLRPVPDVPTAARFIVETAAWFALHRHGDPDSAMLDDQMCRRTVRHLLMAAFLPVPGEDALE